MLEFFASGGWSMLVVTLFGALTLHAAVRFVRRPRAETVGALRALSLATTFVVCGGVAANLAAVCTKVPNHPEWSIDPKVGLIVLTGIGESLAPAILGLSLLAVAWFVAAVGARREERDADRDGHAA